MYCTIVPAGDVEPVPSKLTNSPWQISAGTASGMVATALGFWQGTVHWKPAEKLPTPVPFDWKTRVRQPLVLNTVPLTIRFCNCVPV